MLQAIPLQEIVFSRYTYISEDQVGEINPDFLGIFRALFWLALYFYNPADFISFIPDPGSNQKPAPMFLDGSIWSLFSEIF